MNNKRKLSLSAENAARQREIARYLKRGLPLAGVLAAALLCGCDEQPPTPKEDTSQMPPDKLIEIMRASATGGIIVLPRDHEDAEKPDNRKNEDDRRPHRVSGKPPNRGEKRAAANATEEVK